MLESNNSKNTRTESKTLPLNHLPTNVTEGIDIKLGHKQHNNNLQSLATFNNKINPSKNIYSNLRSYSTMTTSEKLSTISNKQSKSPLLFPCNHCNKTYKKIQSLRNHRSKKHANKKNIHDCPFCKHTCKGFMSIVNHQILKHPKKHSFKIKIIKKKERATQTLLYILEYGNYSYSRSTGPKETKLGETTYYICNQNKNSGECRAFVKVTEREKDICLVYNNKHLHGVSLKDTKLRNSQKLELVSYLANGTSINELHKRIIQDVDVHNITKLQSVTKNYLRYLLNSYIKIFKFYKDDFKNTQAFLDHSVKNNKIKYFLYKDKNIDVPGSPSIKENFILSFQTQNQYEAMLNENSTTVMADSTHSTNLYGFYLTTFAILTQKQRFLPILFVITDNESEKVYSYVLDKFLDKGLVPKSPNTLMSDMAAVFYNSWKKTVFKDVSWLYCIWHFKRSIYSNMVLKIKDKSVRELAKEKFKKMIKTMVLKDFNKRLKIFVSFTYSKARVFHDYFSCHYLPVVQRWGTPYRLESEVNTNMFLEGFHGGFKKEYLKRESKNRLDDLISLLVLYDNRRHLYNHLSVISDNCEYIGYREAVALKKHKKSLKLKNDKFRQRTRNIYYKNYTIKLGKCRKCDYTCLNICRICKICKNRYSCSCFSYSIKKECCKHIHKAHMLYGKIEDGALQICDKDNKKQKFIRKKCNYEHTAILPPTRSNSGLYRNLNEKTHALNSIGPTQTDNTPHTFNYKNPTIYRTNVPTETNTNKSLSLKTHEGQNRVYSEQEWDINEPQQDADIIKRNTHHKSLITSSELIERRKLELKDNIQSINEKIEQSNSLIYLNSLAEKFRYLNGFKETKVDIETIEYNKDTRMFKKPKTQRNYKDSKPKKKKT